MRCYICDVELSEGEISLDRQMKSNPCTSCNQIIYETAFSDGFNSEDYGSDFEPDEDKFTEAVEEDVLYEGTNSSNVYREL